MIHLSLKYLSVLEVQVGFNVFTMDFICMLSAEIFTWFHIVEWCAYCCQCDFLNVNICKSVYGLLELYLHLICRRLFFQGFLLG